MGRGHQAPPCEDVGAWAGRVGPARNLDRLLTQSVPGRVCSIPLRARERAAVVAARSPVWVRATRTWLRDDGRARPSVDGVLGMQLHGGNYVLEPGQVVGDGRAVTRIELDPVATASGCDDRQGATDLSGAAVDGDGLGRVAPSSGVAICSASQSSGVESPIGCEPRIRNRSVSGSGRTGRRPGEQRSFGETSYPSRARSPPERSIPRGTTVRSRAASR